MTVFVAGGTGAIGVPLVRALVASGHQVTALTRSAANAPMLRALGATAAVADALDAPALRTVVLAARPTHVIHQLTALPKGGPRRARDLAPTNRLRISIEGMYAKLVREHSAKPSRLLFKPTKRAMRQPSRRYRAFVATSGIWAYGCRIWDRPLPVSIGR